MLEVSELKLPVDHTPEQLAEAVAVALHAPHGEVLTTRIHKRAIDARRGRVLLIYTLHVSVRDEAAALEHHRKELAKVQVLPERRYAALDGILVREQAPDLRPVLSVRRCDKQRQQIS